MSNETNQQVIVQNVIQQSTTTITTTRHFSVGWFIFWLLVFWPAAVIQVILFFCKPATVTVTH